MNILKLIKQTEENINNITEAISKAAISGGVVQYSLNTGQGSTSVRQASLSELQAVLRTQLSLLNELKQAYDGTNIIMVRDTDVYYNSGKTIY